VWSEKGGPTGILRPDQTAHACNMSQYPPVYHKFYGAARHVTRRKTLLHSSLLSLSSPCGPSLAHLSAKTNFDSSRVEVSAAIHRTSCLLLTLKWLLYGNAPSPPASKLIISIRKTGWRRLSLIRGRSCVPPIVIEIFGTGELCAMASPSARILEGKKIKSFRRLLIFSISCCRGCWDWRIPF
jgi:hypothetical protein